VIALFVAPPVAKFRHCEPAKQACQPQTPNLRHCEEAVVCRRSNLLRWDCSFRIFPIFSAPFCLALFGCMGRRVGEDVTGCGFVPNAPMDFMPLMGHLCPGCFPCPDVFPPIIARQRFGRSPPSKVSGFSKGEGGLIVIIHKLPYSVLMYNENNHE
jgi:hypothetical protein